jgi:hypothetical protein
LTTKLEERAGRSINVEETLAREEQQRKDQWTRLSVPSTEIQSTTVTDIAIPSVSVIDYSNYSKAELIEQAKTHLLPHKGTIDDLRYQVAKAEQNKSRARVDDDGRAKEGLPARPSVAAVDYTQYPKAILIEQAKKRHLPCEGSKEELISRLTNADKIDRLIKAAQNYDVLKDRGVSIQPIQGENGRELFSKDGINYNTKDNSKLITLLQDRGLDIPETRIAKIELLEKNPSDYYAKHMNQLIEMMERRHVRVTKGTKKYLVETLKRNDDVDRDTGNVEEAAMCGKLPEHVESYPRNGH